MSSNKDTEKPKASLWLILLGVLIAVLPIAIAIIITPPGGNPLSECGTCEGAGGGAVIWYTLFTIPLGLFVVAMGFGSNAAKRIGLALLKRTILYNVVIAIRDALKKRGQ
jgi:TRAP-type mannitol/chloroaromatic compound transport system permease small subunit